MDTSAVGLARTFAVTQAAQTRQNFEIAMLRQQAQSEQSLVQMLEQSLEATAPPPPAPEGQGRHVDIQV